MGKMINKTGTSKEGRWENGQNVEWFDTPKANNNNGNNNNNQVNGNNPFKQGDQTKPGLAGTGGQGKK